MAHPYLRWLKIHRYEGFEGVEIEFSPEENLILGVNGAGKTQLLRLIDAVIDLRFVGLRELGFDVEFDLACDVPLSPYASGTPGWIRGRVRNEPTTRVQHLPLDPTRDPVHEMHGDFTADVVLLTEGGVVPELVIKVEAGEVRFEGRMSPFALAHNWSLPLLKHLTESRHPRSQFAIPSVRADALREDDSDFRELIMEVEFTELVESPGVLQINLDRWRDYFSLIVFAADHDVTSGVLKRTPEGVGVPFYLRMHDHHVADFLAALRATELRLHPKMLREDGTYRTFKGMEVSVVFASGATFRDLGLTFGQRRFLFFGLLALLHPKSVFLIDELDNGLHPRLVEALMLLLQGRQRFFASHNKLVIDYTAFESPDDVQKKIHIVRRDDEGRQHVEQISDAEAKEVFEKIDVGIMHPADVLEVEGLW